MSISFTDSYPQLETEFVAHGIPTQAPAFYDHPNFLALERTDPAALIAYARFVQTRPYEKSYLDRARSEIPAIIRSYYPEVKAAGRMGACIDASLVLMRILEREGFWVSAFKGALHIVPGPHSGLDATTFYAFGGPRPDAPAGHVWLAAPPFQIIDTTVQLQPYQDQVAAVLPEYILTESASPFTTGLGDIADAPVLRALSAAGLNEDMAFRRLNSELPGLRQVFRGLCVSHEMTVLRYAPTGITASDGSLENNRAMHFARRRFGIHIYHEIIQPMLKQMRATKAD